MLTANCKTLLGLLVVLLSVTQQDNKASKGQQKGTEEHRKFWPYSRENNRENNVTSRSKHINENVTENATRRRTSVPIDCSYHNDLVTEMRITSEN